MKHSPTPWFINGPHHLQATSQPGDSRPRIIAQFVIDRPEREADEAFVVRAVNAFDELLEFVRNFEGQYEAADELLAKYGDKA